MNIFLKILLIGLSLIISFAAQAQLQTVKYVDLAKYSGTWYQIARNPHPFEYGCICARQILVPTADARISVYNSCNDRTIDGPYRTIQGFASVLDATSNAKLSVDFGLPQKGAYWIIGLDTQYRYAVVSDPSKRTLYILSKTTTLENSLYNEAVQNAAIQLDTSKLSMTLQQGCIFP